MKGRAQGRVVLTGEHSVVYGYPAVTSSISLSVIAEISHQKQLEPKYVGQLKDFFVAKTGRQLPKVYIHLKSQIPIGSGLSSSTAVAAAVFKCLYATIGQELDPASLFELLVEFESQTYPVSGMDQAAVAFGGLLRFQKQANQYQYHPLHTSALKDKQIWLIDSGKPQETTKELVALVKNNHSQLASVLATMGECSHDFIQNLLANRLDLDLVGENQRLLTQLGVVGDRASNIVKQIEKSGGAAKISGAGGIKHGSGILLAFHPDTEKMTQLLKTQTWRHWLINLGE